jgi:hypothetical protein
MSLIVPPEAIYDDVDSAFTVIQAHTSEHGYTFCQHQIRSNRRVFACDRASKYDARGKDPNTNVRCTSYRVKQSTPEVSRAGNGSSW